jgi:integrase
MKSVAPEITLDIINQKIGFILTLGKLEDAEKMEALIYFLYYTGISKREFMRVKRKYIDLKVGLLTLPNPSKTRNVRRYLPKQLIKILKPYFKKEKEGINAFNITSKEFSTMIGKFNRLPPREAKVLQGSFRASYSKRRKNKRKE